MSSNKDGSVNRKFDPIFSMCNTAISLCMGLIYTPFAIRLLGQGEYAISNLAASVISYLSILDLGFSNTLVRYSARNRAKGEDDSGINGLFLFLYILIAFAALLIGGILGHVAVSDQFRIVPRSVNTIIAIATLRIIKLSFLNGRPLSEYRLLCFNRIA